MHLIGRISSLAPDHAFINSVAEFQPAEPSEDSAPPQTGNNTDPRCKQVNGEYLNTAFQIIDYCLPITTESVDIAVVERQVNPQHGEFLEKDGASRIKNATASIPTTTAATNHPVAEIGAVDHGTHIAGIIAAAGTGKQMVGLAPSTKIYVVQPTGFKDFVDNWIDIRTYNLSLGEVEEKLNSSNWALAVMSMRRVIQNHPSILFIIAAGNESSEVAPDSLAGLGGELTNTIVVGASNTDVPPSLFTNSNFSRKRVGIVAPGVGVKSATYDGGYGLGTGTSQAAALVTGTVALLLGNGASTWRPYQIRERILSTADLWLTGENNSSEKVFSGILNVKRAVLDMDRTILRFLSDTSAVCKGKIRLEDLKKTIRIDQSGRAPLSFLYRDLRRLKRNKTNGKYTVIYSEKEPDEDEFSWRLHRIEVKGENISAPGFSMEDASSDVCRFNQVQLTDLDEFVYGSY